MLKLFSGIFLSSFLMKGTLTVRKEQDKKEQWMKWQKEKKWHRSWNDRESHGKKGKRGMKGKNLETKADKAKQNKTAQEVKWQNGLWKEKKGKEIKMEGEERELYERKGKGWNENRN